MEQNKRSDISPFQHFFWWCSGVNKDILTGKTSDFTTPLTTEYNKYVGIGTAIFFTACFATISSSFAIFYLVQSFGLDSWAIFAICAFLGIFWGFNIFFLDRYIVSTMRKHENKWVELRQAAPRFVIATIFAFTITVPLEVALFSGTINDEMNKFNESTISDCENEFKKKVVERNADIAILDKQLEDKKKNKPVGYDELDKQRENRRNQIPPLQNKIVQNKPIINRNYELDPDYPENSPYQTRPNATAKKLIYENNKLRNQITNANKEIARIDAEIHQKFADFDKEVQDFEKQINKQKEPILTEIARLQGEYSATIQNCIVTAKGRTDLLARYDALEKLKGNTFSSIWWASWMLRALFLMLEIAPILSKIIAKRGTYDDRIDSIESKERLQISELNSKINERLTQIRSDFDLTTELKKLDNEYALKKAILERELELQQQSMPIQNQIDELEKISKIKLGENENTIAGELRANKQIIDEIVKRQFELAQMQIDEWYKAEKEKISKNSNSYVNK